jgi:hypothetical protein
VASRDCTLAATTMEDEAVTERYPRRSVLHSDAAVPWKWAARAASAVLWLLSSARLGQRYRSLSTCITSVLGRSSVQCWVSGVVRFRSAGRGPTRVGVRCRRHPG